MKNKPVLDFVRIEARRTITVVRDDLLTGGTKEAVLLTLLPSIPERELVFASPRQGFAQIALAAVAKATGRKATLFETKSKVTHPRSALALALGATIHQVPCGCLAVCQARAREYCARTGARLFPLGLAIDGMVEAISRRALLTGLQPTEVWCVAGSGALTRGLQIAWPTAKFFAVAIGKPPHAGKAKVIVASEKFNRDAEEPPPFPSCSNYDAKAWRHIVSKASHNALFWNVAA